jgi:hypothetical protein
MSDVSSIRLAARRRADPALQGGVVTGSVVGPAAGWSPDPQADRMTPTAPGDGSRLDRAISAMKHQQGDLVGHVLRLEELVTAIAGRMLDPAPAENRVRPATLAKLAQVEDLLADSDETLARLNRVINALNEAVG